MGRGKWMKSQRSCWDQQHRTQVSLWSSGWARWPQTLQGEILPGATRAS